MKDPILVLIGGCEDLTGRKEILHEFVRLAGGKRARLVTLTAATSRPERTGEEYAKVFRSLGASWHVAGSGRPVRSAGTELLERIEQATGIFITGGDQLRAVRRFLASELQEVLLRRYREGVVVGGTSAGAVLMAETMITGRSCEVVARPGAVELSPGIGLIKDVLIDSHFSQRCRFGRLAVAVLRNCPYLGIGIDENTAVIIRGTRGEVLGDGTVTLIDGREIGYSDLAGGRQDKPVTVSGLKVHLIAGHHCFDLGTGELVNCGKLKER